MRLLLSAFVSLTIALAPLSAQARGLIRDAEIEYALSQLAQPILQAAGLPGSIRILVINDDKPNAFVADSRHIFVHSGLLLRLDGPAPVQAVLAHEAAHIANGHLTRRAGNIGAASNAAKMGLLLALAAGVAGGADAGIGVAAGTSSAAMRSLFAHTRAEEASADQSSLRYMAAAGIDPKAAIEVLDMFKGQEALSASRQDPYVLTHPLSRDRIRAVQGFAATVTARDRDQTAAIYWYARATGKLSAFLRAPSWTLRRVRGKTDEISLMRAAIAYHRQPKADRALAAIDQLLRLRPNDPYYHELKGQILLESRQPAASVASYQRAAQLAPGQPLIMGGLGRALLAQDTNASNREALRVLSSARARDPSDPQMLRNLALAHARAGENGMASVATAERYAVLGRMKDAGTHAERALGLLPRGSAGWLRAQDVASAAQRAAR